MPRRAGSLRSKSGAVVLLLDGEFSFHPSRSDLTSLMPAESVSQSKLILIPMYNVQRNSSAVKSQ